MSSKKLSTAEFIAIYRLDFYKNKKNWKLYSEKNKPVPKTRNPLNVTFDLDRDATNLNDAFIDTGSDSDKTSKTSPDKVTKPNLSQQWLHSVNIWPTNVQNPKYDDNILQNLLVGNKPAADTEFNDYADNKAISNTNIASGQRIQDFQNYTPDIRNNATQNTTETDIDFVHQKWDKIYPDGYRGACIQGDCHPVDNVGSCGNARTQKRLEDLIRAGQVCGMDHGDARYYENCRPGSGFDSQRASTTEIYRAESWPQVERWLEDVKTDVDMIDGADGHNYISSPELWSLHKQLQIVEEQMSGVSVDSFGEFTRGADLAPHCSEIELHVTGSVKGEELDANSIARMSSSQLSAAIQRQAHVLARLFWEQGERRKLRQSRSMYSGMSFEEPTHDVGPGQTCSGYRSTRQNCSDFIAGSFRSSGSRVVIEGGRPVRLRGDCV